jgi:membrane protein implicated in regulation of membrane protease activity
VCHLILFIPVFALPAFWLFPFSTALPLYLFILVISGFLYFKVFHQEAMLGKEGLVVKDIAPEGKIQYANEIWDAMAEEKWFPIGERVRIKGFQGMRLLVEERPIETEH